MMVGQFPYVLAVSSGDSGHSCLRGILQRVRWKLDGVLDCAQALAFLRRNCIPVVVCDSQLPDGSWQDLLEQIGKLASPPHVVVCSPAADDHLRAEVLNLGGFDLLLTPFDDMEVLGVVGAAFRAWRNRRESLANVSELPA